MLDLSGIDVKRAIRNTLLVVLGTFVLAFGLRVFAVPYNLVTGGVAGLCIVVKQALSGIPFFASLDISVYVGAMSWALFILGFFTLGRAFTAKTFVSTLVYPIALSLVSLLVESEVLGGFLDLLSDKYAAYGSATVIIASVFAGATIGAGCALTFLGGGSTGGLDIVAFIICKYVRRAKSSVMIFLLDAAVIVLGMFVINDVLISLLGIAAALISAVTIDKLFIGESGAFVAYIVSDKYDEISRSVIQRMSRTTTIVDAVGGYSRSHKKMVIVTFSFSQYADFTALIAAVDKNAFVTLHRAHEINGEGWTYGLHRLGEAKGAEAGSDISDGDARDRRTDEEARYPDTDVGASEEANDA